MGQAQRRRAVPLSAHCRYDGRRAVEATAPACPSQAHERATRAYATGVAASDHVDDQQGDGNGSNRAASEEHDGPVATSWRGGVSRTRLSSTPSKQSGV